jgi:beta-lactamase regulating signal transducer with metallopeptidase domain
MNPIRKFAIALGLLVLAAIPMGLVGPTKPDTKGYDSAVSAALANAEMNNSSASGAPQQQVVNGWVARDLAVVQIKQNNDMLMLMHVVAALLLTLVLAVVFTGLSMRRKGEQEARQEEPAGPRIEPVLSGA